VPTGIPISGRERARLPAQAQSGRARRSSVPCLDDAAERTRLQPINRCAFTGRAFSPARAKRPSPPKKGLAAPRATSPVHAPPRSRPSQTVKPLSHGQQRPRARPPRRQTSRRRPPTGRPNNSPPTAFAAKRRNAVRQPHGTGVSVAFPPNHDIARAPVGFIRRPGQTEPARHSCTCCLFRRRDRLCDLAGLTSDKLK